MRIYCLVIEAPLSVSLRRDTPVSRVTRGPILKADSNTSSIVYEAFHPFGMRKSPNESHLQDTPWIKMRKEDIPVSLLESASFEGDQQIGLQTVRRLP